MRFSRVANQLHGFAPKLPRFFDEIFRCPDGHDRIGSSVKYYRRRQRLLHLVNWRDGPQAGHLSRRDSSLNSGDFEIQNGIIKDERVWCVTRVRTSSLVTSVRLQHRASGR